MKKLIKQKKVWTEVFSKRELKDIWNHFYDLLPEDLKQEVENSSYKGKKNLFPNRVSKDFRIWIHPETDVEDNSTGVQPLILKELINSKGIDNVFNDFRVIMDFLKEIYPYRKTLNLNINVIEDGFFHFNNLTASLRNTNADSVIEAYFLRGLSKESFFKYLKFGFKESVVKINLIAWRRNKFQPRLDLFKKIIHPNNFSVDSVLPFLESVYGFRQFNKIKDEIEMIKMMLIVNAFGSNLKYLDLKDKITKKSLKTFNIHTPIVIRKMESLSKKLNHIKGLSLIDLAMIINVASILPNIEATLLKSNNIKNNVLSVIRYTFKGFNMEEFTHTLNVNELKMLTYEHLRSLKKYNSNNSNDSLSVYTLKELFKIYTNRSKISNLPNLKGKIGDYSYEILSKDSIDGLFLGYITDCCQVFGCAGSTCLNYGYESPDSGFFVVRKKGKIVAQSWVWIYSDIFAFDSVEALGRNTSDVSGILNCYSDAANQLKNQYDFLAIAGLSGTTVPNGLADLGETKMIGDIIDIAHADDCDEEQLKFEIFGNYVYSDVFLEGVLLFNLKKDKK